MTRHSTSFGAFEIDSLPSQPQIGVCHAFFVRHDQRGNGLAHTLKQRQAAALNESGYDYGLCTCDGANVAQQRVLIAAGWLILDNFHNSKTGGVTQIWGKAVSAAAEQKPKPQLERIQIHNIIRNMPDGMNGFLKTWGLNQFARAVFDEANLLINANQPATTQPDARRVAACLKVCEGISTNDLEHYYGHQGGINQALEEASQRDHVNVVIQRDALLSALRLAREGLAINLDSLVESSTSFDGGIDPDDAALIAQERAKLATIDAAIAKAEGTV